MTRWSWSKEEKPVEVSVKITASPGTIIAVEGDPAKAVVIAEKPKDPEPDLSTKPEDIVGYCFGFACPKKHVQEFFEAITLDRYSERRPCSKCGDIAKPCVVKKIAEAVWHDRSSSWHPRNNPDWGWSQYYARGDAHWTDWKFFHYLENPKRGKK